MASSLPELSLDLSPPAASLPRFPVAGEFFLDELPKLNDFIKGLEDELAKISAFKRELPLSFLLLTDAIGKLKEEARKRGERRQEGKLEESRGAKLGIDDDQFEKRSWMSSAQLWSPRKEGQDDSDRSREWQQPCKYRVDGGAFPSLPGDSAPGLSLMTPGLKTPSRAVEDEPGSRREKAGALPGSVFYAVVDQTVKPQTKPPYQTARKQRRCWSPELHRRFIDALERLGGCQVATPKQIRELMQVEGLTNDEVKSHLQKYRLHIRKLPASRSSPSSSNDLAIGGDQLELGCSRTEIPNSGSPEGPLHLARSGKCNSTSMEDEDDEEKSDGRSWKVQHP